MTRPNVLLVVMDSVRAANTSLHGHEHRTTPFLESFADTATVYDQARSPGTWSLPSHASMFTGYHVVEHNLTRARYKLKPGHSIFEELSREYDYATGVFSENTWITDMDVGLSDGFETVEGARNLLFPDAVDPSNFVLTEGQGKYGRFLRHALERDDTLKSIANGAFTKAAWDYPWLLPDRFASSTPADVYADLFLDWSGEREGPWAACVNFMDGHLPYLPGDAFDHWGGRKLRALQDEMDDQVWGFNGGHRPWWQRKALEGLYDGTIRQMDAQIDRLLSALADRGELDDTLVVVTSDHGEGFGEPSRIRGDRDSETPNARVAAHGAGIHEVLCHVPLLVKWPGQDAARRIGDPASLTEFPRVVRGVVADGTERDFVPEEPVIVSSHGLEEPMEDRAAQYVAHDPDDEEPFYRFNGDARAVVVGADDGASKYVSWRDRRRTVYVHDAKSSYVSADADDGVVDERFADLADADVREEGAGVEAIDATTADRLEDLGYI